MLGVLGWGVIKEVLIRVCCVGQAGCVWTVIDDICDMLLYCSVPVCPSWTANSWEHLLHDTDTSLNHKV